MEVFERFLALAFLEPSRTIRCSHGIDNQMRDVNTLRQSSLAVACATALNPNLALAKAA